VIDEEARARATDLLESLLGQGITNYALEDSWPTKTQDNAVVFIGEQLWLWYDDFPEEKLSRKCFTKSQIETLERCLIFLRSDRTYAWPKYSPKTRNLKWFERLFRMGGKRSSEGWEKFQNAGDLNAWPFLSQQEYEAELQAQRQI
jgi:hypothetical protein